MELRTECSQTLGFEENSERRSWSNIIQTANKRINHTEITFHLKPVGPRICSECPTNSKCLYVRTFTLEQVWINALQHYLWYFRPRLGKYVKTIYRHPFHYLLHIKSAGTHLSIVSMFVRTDLTAFLYCNIRTYLAGRKKLFGIQSGVCILLVQSTFNKTFEIINQWYFRLCCHNVCSWWKGHFPKIKVICIKLKIT